MQITFAGVLCYAIQDRVRERLSFSFQDTVDTAYFILKDIL
jgi:hypothetical protein